MTSNISENRQIYIFALGSLVIPDVRIVMVLLSVSPSLFDIMAASIMNLYFCSSSNLAADFYDFLVFNKRLRIFACTN